MILDNLSAHKSPLVKRWVARHPRFQFHFTPTYSGAFRGSMQHEARMEVSWCDNVARA